MFRLPALAVVLCGLALAACGEVSRSPELPAADGVVSGVVRREGEPAPARVRLFLLEAGTGYERTWAPSAEVGLAGTLAVGEPLDTQEAGADGRYRFGPVAAGRYQVHAVHADGWQAVHTLDLPVSGAAETADLALVGGEHVLGGRATYADGRPFEGRVWVAPTRQRRGWRPLPAGSWPADVADDGTFEVRALEARGYVLHLHRPDALFAERHPTQVPHDEALEVVVDEGAVEVAGRVLSAPAGEPVPGAVVSIQGRGPNGRLVVRARTDAEGRFEVLGPPEERVIRVSADGFGPTQAKHASDSDFHARLEPLAVVRGRAVNHATGRPVAGVRMHVCPVGTGSRHARRGSVVTGEDGSFSLNRAPPGEVMLYATGSGWISAALLGPRDASQCPCAFTLHPGEVREMDVPVVPASRTTGRVLDAEGRPVSGVVVRANRVGRAATSSLFPPYRAVTATDEQGRFAFDDLVAGVAHRLVARPSGRAGTRSDVVYPSASLDVELRLPAPRWLDVRVVERATEAPVAGAKVTATRAVGTWSTDADGRARVGPLGAGKVSVWADHPKFVELGKRMLVPGAEEEGDPDPVVVALDRGQTMRGRAFLPDGRPQPNGTIRVESQGRLLAASIPSSDGAFVFSRLPAGTLDVIAQCTVEGRSFVGRSRVEAERGEVLVSLRDAGPARIPDVARAVLHVRVVDEAGRPVVGGNARLHGARAGVSRRLSQGGADLLRIALADETRVEVSGARSVDGTALAATLSGPVALSDEEVEIRLAAGGKVTGRVLDVDGMPVAGIHLFARVRPPKEAPENPIGGRHATALTDPDGSFVLEGLGEARYTLDWALPRRLRVAEAVLVEPGDRDVVVVLEKALAGTLTVVDDDGRPVPGAVVELRQMPRELPGGGFIGFGGRVPPPQTDEAGEHPFGPLDDRFDYSLRVEPPGDRSDLAVFEEEPWEPESGLVRLQKGLVLRGHVRLLGGRRIDELKVTCRPAGQRALEVKPGPDGSFAFENLPPGPATLGLRLDRVGMDTWSRRKEVRTGETDVVYEVDLGAPLRVEIANWPKGQREYLRFAVLLPESHLPENPSLRPHARLGRTMRFEGLDPDETYTLRVVGMDDGTCFVGRGIVPGPDVRRIRLVPGRTIRGQLLLPPGHEKPSVTASSGLDGVSGTVDERGTFEIRGLPDGEWRVKARASGPDGTWSMGEVFVQAGDEVGILLEEFDG